MNLTKKGLHTMSQLILLDRQHRVLLIGGARDAEHTQWTLPIFTSEQEINHTLLVDGDLHFLGASEHGEGSSSTSVYLCTNENTPIVHAEIERHVWVPIVEMYSQPPTKELDPQAILREYEQIVLQGYALPSPTFDVWYFGNSQALALKLARLVLDGTKKGTCGSLPLLDQLNIPKPKQGGISVITDYLGKPLCIIETVHWFISPYSEVTEEFARSEGEGDLSLAYWREAHWNYFTREHARYGLEEFTESCPLACEQFRVLHKLVS